MGSMGNARAADVGSVEQQLAQLWREASGGDQAVMRACMLNWIVACRGPEDLAVATRAVARLSERYPGRALVVSHEAEAAGSGENDRMRVYVSAHCHLGPGGKQVCSEQVSLEARGDGWELVPSTVLSLIVEDCPVYTWWRRPRLEGEPLFRPLLELSDRFVVDSARARDPAAALGTLASEVAATRRRDTGDLAWVRIKPWCELVASLFDSPSMRSYLDRIDAVFLSTAGPACGEDVTLAGAYLAGWLASRLDWRPTDDPTLWRRGDGGPVRIACEENPKLRAGEIGSARLEATTGGARAGFEARRLSDDGEIVRLSVDVKGNCPLPFKHRVVRPDDLTLLCGHLESDPRDPVFTEALAAASRIAGNPAPGEHGSPK